MIYNIKSNGEAKAIMREDVKHDFRYISKNDPKVKQAYQDLLDILRQVQNLVREKFTFKFTPVGSYPRNMITYDTKSNVGFDFDINIEVNDDDENYTAQEIKDILRNALNRVAGKYGYSYAEDSTRVITIKAIDRSASRIVYSCDFAIVYNYSEGGKPRQQYIHFNKTTRTYSWCNQAKGYYMLQEKIEWLKRNGYWQELRDYYLYKKNINTNPDIHSRTLLAIAVQEMCQKNGYYK